MEHLPVIFQYFALPWLLFISPAIIAVALIAFFRVMSVREDEE